MLVDFFTLLAVLAYLTSGNNEDSRAALIVSHRSSVPAEASADASTLQDRRSPLRNDTPRQASDIDQGDMGEHSSKVVLDWTDRSGLTLEQKINKIVRSYDRFHQSRADEDPMRRATAEYWLAVHSAITVLQASNEGQYELDVDDGANRGFNLRAPAGSMLQVAADNAKYEISMSRFPAVGLALERRRFASLEPGYLPELTAHEFALYEQCAEEALATLGVAPSSSAAPPTTTETTSTPR